MKKYKVFDINKPILSDKAEIEIEANSGADAVRKVLGDNNIIVRQVKHGGRFVVSSTRQKRVYHIFNN